jgi:DNA-binding transcriptional MerR regulator
VSAGVPTGPAYLSIGEVLNQLRAQFPDVTISKIRFLESEGLVEPERTRAGYRQFSTDDVERLRFILECQRDRYLPLRVIREHLAGLDRGDEPALPMSPASVGSVAPPEQQDDTSTASAPPPSAGSPPATAGDRTRRPETETFASDLSEVRLNRRELAAAAGLRADQLTELERYGLVATRSGGSHFDGDALIVARTVAALGRFGLEPRHLRAYKTAADREIGLIEQVVSPYARARGGEARKHAATVAHELAALSLRLHTALVRAGLSADLLR